MTDLQDGARNALRDLITRAGADVVDDPRRLRNMLADALPTYPIEAGVLGAALDDGIVAELHARAKGGSGPTLAQLGSRLARARAMSPDAARWSIDSWASALGLPPEHDPPPGSVDIGSSIPPTVTGDTGQQSYPDASGTTRPPWQPTRPWLWPAVGAGSALVLIVIAVFLSTRGGDPGDTPSPVPSTPAARDVTSWHRLDVGQCHDFPTDTLNIELIPCAESHDLEVFDARVFTDPAGAPYPADLDDVALTHCQGDPFTDYVGVPWADSKYDVDYLIPIADGWDLGDRELICELFDPAGPMVGSKASSGE